MFFVDSITWSTIIIVMAALPVVMSISRIAMVHRVDRVAITDLRADRPADHREATTAPADIREAHPEDRLGTTEVTTAVIQEVRPAVPRVDLQDILP